MLNNSKAMPEKEREIHSNHFDSTIWNDFRFRDDDIIIATYGKSGTTWTQQIISQLIFNGKEGLEVAEMSPWMDLRVPPKEVKLDIVEKQNHRRFLKTHLPVDALVMSEKAKYLYIARDGRDVAWSWYNHHINANDQWYKALNDTPGLVGPPMQEVTVPIRDYFLQWLNEDGYPWWPYFSHIKSWWNVKNLPNVKIIHFANLKKDIKGQIREIADFFEIEVDDSKWDSIFYHCSFEYMKNNSERIVPLNGAFWDGGSKTFLNKGQNGRWEGVLSEEDNEKYLSMAENQLGNDCAHWLLTGELIK